MAGVGPAQLKAKVQKAPAAPVPVNPTITSSAQSGKQFIVIVKKSYTAPARVPILLKTDAKFKKSGTLDRVKTPTSGDVRFFRAATPGVEITFNGTDNVFPGNQLTAGVTILAEARGASSNLDDFELTLTLSSSAAPVPVGPPASVKITAVALTLDISASRPSAGVAPPPLAQPPAVAPAPGVVANDKWFGGRLISAQDPGNNQERALLTIGPVLPTAFAGVLLLRQVSVSGTTVGALTNKTQVFDGANETPTPGELAKSNPHEIDTSVTPIPAGGLQFWIQGKNVSAGSRDTGFQLGIKNIGNDGDRVAVTVGVASLITLATRTILVKRTYTSPVRQAVTLRTGTAFNRAGTLQRSSNGVRLFTAATAGTEITFNGTDNVFTGARLTAPAGVQLFAEGSVASGAVDDFGLTLTLAAGASPPAGLPATAKMTVVQLTLDIFLPPTAPGIDPNPLPQPPATKPAAGTATDKWFAGRAIHIQDPPANHHKRALLIVRPVQPAHAAILVLRQVAVTGDVINGLSAKAGLFDTELGGTAKGNSFEFDAGSTAGGRKFFVEGATASGGVRDTGFQLGIKGVEDDGDRVTVTVVKVQLDVTGVNAPDKNTVGGLLVRNQDGNNAPRKKITIQKVIPASFAGAILLQCASNKVTFHDAVTAGNKIPIDGTKNKFANAALPKNVFIEGEKFSDALRDIEIFVDIENVEQRAEAARLTVLWLDKPTVALAGAISANNDKRNAYRDWTKTGTFNLGLQEYNANFLARMGWGSEARATVHPTGFNFPGNDLKLERDYFFRDYNGSNQIGAGNHNATIPPGNDTGPAAARDDNPAPDNTIYDWDAAGLLIPNAPVNTIHRTRNNFWAFASITVEGQTVRCSEKREYFIRFSMKQVTNPSGTDWRALTPPDIPSDNQAGDGTTNVTHDLT